MDRAKNPFSPGAGTPPPELAGREAILEDAQVALTRVKDGRAEKSLMLVGLRGTGKTVLLGEIQRRAEDTGYKVVFIEAYENRQKKSLTELLAPHLRKLIFDLDRGQSISQKAKRALRVFKSFVNSMKVKIGDLAFYIDIDPESGTADSGDLAVDLTAVFVAIGEAAKERETAVAIIIDELQYLEEKELSAMIMAMHRISQLSLPLILIGAGLPQLIGKAGNSKSYAERLFAYPEIGALDKKSAHIALAVPAKSLGIDFTEDALNAIYECTRGYPYFLQEWGYHVWNSAQQSPITADDVAQATIKSLQNLDKNFFRVRLDRLTPTEKRYVRALADLGDTPQKSGDIASKMGKSVERVAPIRAQLIAKGMIYSPAHGNTAFTVPLFEEFLKREIPDFDAMMP